MRYLAIDLGEKRTGLAGADDVSGIVTPLDQLTVAVGPELAQRIVTAARHQDADVLIIGLPLNMDGTESPRSKAVRAFGAELAALSELDVRYHDERLTTFEANQQMAQSGRTRKQKKRVRDALAAAALLQDYLDINEST